MQNSRTISQMKRPNVISPVECDVRKVSQGYRPAYRVLLRKTRVTKGLVVSKAYEERRVLLERKTASSVVARSRYLPSFALQNSMSKPKACDELRRATEYVIFAEIYRKIGILRSNKNVASFSEANAGS